MPLSPALPLERTGPAEAESLPLDTTIIAFISHFTNIVRGLHDELAVGMGRCQVVDKLWLDIFLILKRL